MPFCERCGIRTEGQRARLCPECVLFYRDLAERLGSGLKINGEPVPLLRCPACDAPFMGRRGDPCPKCGQPVGQKPGLPWQYRGPDGFSLRAYFATLFLLHFRPERAFGEVRMDLGVTRYHPFLFAVAAFLALLVPIEVSARGISAELLLMTLPLCVILAWGVHALVEAIVRFGKLIVGYLGVQTVFRGGVGLAYRYGFTTLGLWATLGLAYWTLLRPMCWPGRVDRADALALLLVLAGILWNAHIAATGLAVLHRIGRRRAYAIVLSSLLALAATGCAAAGAFVLLHRAFVK